MACVCQIILSKAVTLFVFFKRQRQLLHFGIGWGIGGVLAPAKTDDLNRVGTFSRDM